MIDLYYWPTPNGWKTTIMLEECGLLYNLIPIALDRGAQRAPEFVELSPNGKIPVIVDHDVVGQPLTIFESAAILVYLAKKANQFLPRTEAEHYRVLQWLIWQSASVGPTLGQNGHYRIYSDTKEPYSIDRFGRETARLYGVLDCQLERTGECVAGEYSIADIALFPWIMTHKAQGIVLDQYPSVKRWFAELRARPALQAGLAVAKELRKPLDAEAKELLFRKTDSPSPLDQGGNCPTGRKDRGSK